MRLIDAHAHIFNTLAGFGAEGELRAIGGGKGIWATGRVQQVIPECYDRAFTAEDFLGVMDRNNVEKAVLLQGGMLGFNNEYLHETVNKHPDRFTAAAAIDPFCRKTDGILDNLLDNLRFRIFKFESSSGCGLMGAHDAFRLDSPRMFGIYERIAAHNGVLVFDLGSPGDVSHQPDAMLNIADRYKDMMIVICHLASPKRHHGEILKSELKELSRDNIAFDLAALHHKTRPEEYPFPVAAEFARMARNIAGDDRLMWGTDSPSTLCRNEYRETIDYLIPVFTGESQDKLFYMNAERIYFS